MAGEMCPHIADHAACIVASFVFALCASAPNQALPQEISSPSWSEGKAEINLPFQADRIFPGPEGMVVALSQQAGSIATIGLRNDRFDQVHRVGSQPYWAAATSSQAHSPGFVVLSRNDASSVTAHLFQQREDGFFDAVDVPVDLVPQDFVEPRAALFSGPRDSSISRSTLVLWDSSGGAPYVRIFAAGKLDDIKVEDQPFHIFDMGIAPTALALHPRSNRVSLTDLVDGYILDSIHSEDLQISAENQIGLFSVAESELEKRSAIAANGNLGILSIFGVEESLAGARLAPPLNIEIERLPSDALPDGRMLVAADPGLVRILVSHTGSNRPGLFRRFSGGIDPIEPLALDEAIRDMTAVSGPDVVDPGVFVFLSMDGTRLTALEAGALFDTRPVDSPLPSDVDASELSISYPREVARIQNPGDIARVQRILASIGFRVGPIDGVQGRLTEAAIVAFQSRSGLEPTGQLDMQTIEALNEVTIGLTDGGRDAQLKEDFQALIEQAVGRLDAARLLTLGVSHENPGHPCFGLNEVAPRQLWPNSIRFASLLKKLEDELGLRVQIVSGYRSPEYNRCVGGSPAENNAHLKFQAFDIRLEDTIEYSESTRRILAAVGILESRGLVTAKTEGIGGVAVHVAAEIGENHAMIATHTADERGCRFAREDVVESATLLANSLLSGREVSISRDPGGLRDLYVVSVDTHRDSAAAASAVPLIRQVAPLTADGKTGSDSFAFRQHDWLEDPTCSQFRVIP